MDGHLVGGTLEMGLKDDLALQIYKKVGYGHIEEGFRLLDEMLITSCAVWNKDGE